MIVVVTHRNHTISLRGWARRELLRLAKHMGTSPEAALRIALEERLARIKGGALANTAALDETQSPD